ATQGITLDKIHTTISEAGQRELAARMNDLRGRDLTASQPITALKNASFEPLGGGETVPGWKLAGDVDHARIGLDATMPNEGKTCVYLQHVASASPATLESNTFATPPTGQLAMSVVVRGENVDPNTELHLGFEVEAAGSTYRRVATLGGQHPDAQPIG